MTNKTKKTIWVFGIILGILGLGWWMFTSVANLPGVAIADQGRDHKSKEENDKFVYNSYPPVSGPHDIDWIRPGVYNTPQDKYKLIHSLEHGYIVIHYKSEEDKKTLDDFANKMGLKKLIVVVDPDLKFPVVMTAWNRILEMPSFDEKIAEKFVNAFRNKGPELTMD